MSSQSEREFVRQADRFTFGEEGEVELKELPGPRRLSEAE
jgi:hypothetical protein